MNVISEQIINLFTTTTLSDYLTGGLWNTIVPEKASLPYGVFIITTSSKNTFSEDIKDVEIEFIIKAHTEDEIETIYDELHKAYHHCTLSIFGWKLTRIEETTARKFFYQKQWEYRVVYYMQMSKDVQ